jgi:hypothetical protein
MPEAKGKLPKGETAKLELNENKIIVSVQRGFISKKMVLLKEIRLENVSGVELLEGEKSFKGSKRLGLKHEGMDGGGELVFYSAETDQITEIHRLIIEELVRREEELQRQMTEYKETRERQLNMLYQDMEMTDQIFNFVLGLGGEVDWRRLHDTLEGTKQVQREMEAFGSSHYSFSLEGLESKLRSRHIKEMKNEAVELLEVVLQGVTEASTHRHRWFNSKYHHLFASTLFLLRNRELSRLTGAADENGERRLGQQAEALMALVGSECLELEDYDVEDFDRARLYSLVDLLLGVPFTSPETQAE